MSAYTPAQARADYRETILDHGESLTLRRLPSSDYSVDGIRLTDRQVMESVGAAQVKRLKFIVVAADVVDAGFPLPFQANKDRLIWNGKTMPILEIDDSTRRTGGELIAYELTVAGA